jgi:Protein of unknown function (DUF732)
MRLTPSLRSPFATAAVLTAVALLAGCSGGDRQAAAIPEAQLLPSGPPPTIEARIRARPWVSSKAHGQAFGQLWREWIRNPKDRDGRGIDAYNWAGRTCDAVRNGGQTPEAMVRRVRDEGRFSAQGARVIVKAALQALCPEQELLHQPLP